MTTTTTISVNVTEKQTVDSIVSNTDWTPTALSNMLIKKGKTEVKDAGSMWRITCAMILRQPEMHDLEKLEDFMSQFGILLGKQDQHNDVPIATKGKTKGQPAWRSWDVTKPRWQYANYIFNAIQEQGSIAAVFPKEQPLPTLADVRKMQKQKKETPLATIKRCSTLIEQKIKELKDEDIAEANSIVSSLSVEVATALAELNAKKGNS